MSWVGILLYVWFVYFYVWPDMVLNQRQVLVSVSDWEPYLGSLFCVGFYGWLLRSLCFAPDRAFFGFPRLLFCSVHVYPFLLNMSQYNHAVFWSSSTSPQENPDTLTVNKDGCVQYLNPHIK
jgi:hypothetical protein